MQGTLVNIARSFELNKVLFIAWNSRGMVGGIFSRRAFQDIQQRGVRKALKKEFNKRLDRQDHRQEVVEPTHI